jgi:hypothetical protein
MKTWIALLMLVAVPPTAAAQTTATVTTNAPIYVTNTPAPSQPPLRVAAVNTTLRVLAQEGEWLQVEFNDPQWGRRRGWVLATFTNYADEGLRPMDLSVRDTLAAPAAVPAPTYPPRPTFGSTPEYRTHITGRSGITFGTETATLAGVEVGGDVLPMLQIYGSFDWHQNVAPEWVQDVGDIISEIVGLDVGYKFPAYVGMGGAKVQVPGRVLRPYGVGGFGVGQVRGKVEVEGEDVTGLFDELGYLDEDDVTFTKPLFEVGGGLGIAVGRGDIDLSYRFRKFLETGEPVNVSGVYVGGGVSF